MDSLKERMNKTIFGINHFILECLRNEGLEDLVFAALSCFLLSELGELRGQ